MVNSFLKSDEISRILRDFYSRPYARGDLRPSRQSLRCLLISTRAPTRGATSQLLPKIRDFVQISTRAPTRGATRGRRGNLYPLHHFYSRPYARGNPGETAGAAPSPHFYSRPYARGDIFTPEGAAKRTGISTHAPTRGATIAYLVDERHLKISTPAPTRGTTAIFHKTTS